MRTVVEMPPHIAEYISYCCSA